MKASTLQKGENVFFLSDALRAAGVYVPCTRGGALRIFRWPLSRLLLPSSVFRCICYRRWSIGSVWVFFGHSAVAGKISASRDMAASPTLNLPALVLHAPAAFRQVGMWNVICIAMILNIICEPSDIPFLIFSQGKSCFDRAFLCVSAIPYMPGSATILNILLRLRGETLHDFGDSIVHPFSIYGFNL